MFYTIQNNTMLYNYQKSLDFLLSKGKEKYGPCFKFYNEDKQIIKKLFTYIIRDEVQAKELNLDLRKGLFLCGPVGCGKTSLMHLIQLLIHPTKRFGLKACRDVSFEFQKQGFDIIHRYSKRCFSITPGSKVPITTCFDDLGAEQNLKYFGSECNVMAEVILSRYELFVSDKLITHLTSNLNANQIEEMYGTRVRSRLREMMNVISWSDTATDKRQ
nr:ATPase [uncultured Carboxylicivirga sp.]